MAKILISHSIEEIELATRYKERLSRYDHEIIQWNRGSNSQAIQSDFENVLQKSDGTLFFLTDSSSDSLWTKREFEFVKSILGKDHKFLIPLVGSTVSTQGIFSGLDPIEIGQNISDAVVMQINDRIARAMEGSPKKTDTNEVQSPKPRLDPISFAKELFKYMESLADGHVIGDWVCRGGTDVAYSTPVGPWDHPGFQFDSNEYSFILRSAWRDNEEWAYLVIESNNLEGQLVNHNLRDTGKYINQAGSITIREMYDMTVGHGRRTRSEVQENLRSAGMLTDLITTFHEDSFTWDEVILDLLRWAIYREKAKMIMQTGKIDDDEPKYWLLKVFGTNWNLPSIKIGDSAYFSAYNESKTPWPDYKEFHALQTGEKGIAFDFSEKQATVFSFEVTRPLLLENDEEIFNFIITNIPVNAFNAEALSPYINKDDLQQSSDRRIFQIPKHAYDEIITPAEPKPTGTTRLRPTLSTIFADTSSKDIPDELEFTSDVNALASVIALREVKPPLAIGLFGNWGSGKSFFIGKLQERIKFLTNEPGTTFCKKVLQINFNSWHYSDSNLWASLITKIFEELEEYGNQKPNEVKELFKNLNSTKELLAETEIEKKKIDKKIKDLTQEKVVQDKEILKQSQELTSLSPKEILIGILYNSSTKEDYENLKNQYSFLNIKEIDDIKERTEELADFFGRCRSIWKYTKEYTKSLNLALALLAFAFIAICLYLLIDIAGFVKGHLEIFIQLAGAISGSLLFARTYLDPAIRAVKKVHVKLVSLNTTVAQLKEQAKQKFDSRQEELNNKISKARSESDEVQKAIDLLQIKSKSLETEIDEITSGKKIIRFIENRVSDTRYINSLGIISWIRKDFEQLDRLLIQQTEALKTNIGQEAATFQLERIILYIDDLDRCHESIVVKVLQAINLLLAFPLFVVVVGVDPRWMNNALNKIYPDFLDKEEMTGNDGHPNILPTSFDYLEKIFQIPLSLRSMDKKGKMQLIASQFKSSPSERSTPQPIAPSPTPVSTDNPTVTVKTSEPVQQKTPTAGAKHAQSEPTKPESLIISDKEKEFMQAIHFLIGDSPRSIKRFINIYRIIRTHTHFEYDVTNDTGDYFAAMIILGVITGQPSSAQIFCQRIFESIEDDLFKAFLEDYLVRSKHSNEALRTLLEELNNPNSKLQPLVNLSMTCFKRNMELVRRFSFRHSLIVN